MELKIDVTISDDLSLSIGYNTFKSKVHIVVSLEPLNMSVCLSVELHFLRNNESFFEYYEMIKYGKGTQNQ